MVTKNKLDKLDASDPIFIHELISMAWSLIANAGEGDWTRESLAWQAAAARWRDDWHRYLRESKFTIQEREKE